MSERELSQTEVTKLELEHRMRMDELRYRQKSQFQIVTIAASMLMMMMFFGFYYFVRYNPSELSDRIREEVKYRAEQFDAKAYDLKIELEASKTKHEKLQAELDNLKARLKSLEAQTGPTP